MSVRPIVACSIGEATPLIGGTEFKVDGGVYCGLPSLSVECSIDSLPYLFCPVACGSFLGKSNYGTTLRTGVNYLRSSTPGQPRGDSTVELVPVPINIRGHWRAGRQTGARFLTPWAICPDCSGFCRKLGGEFRPPARAVFCMYGRLSGSIVEFIAAARERWRARGRRSWPSLAVLALLSATRHGAYWCTIRRKVRLILASLMPGSFGTSCLHFF